MALAGSLAQAQTVTTYLNLNFNDTNLTYAAWGSTALTGLPGNGVSTLRPTTTNSGLFPTAPTNGYLALTPNASNVVTGTYYNGWAANVTLGTINSPYTAGGLGTTNLNKISLTARVRARGMPTNGAVVILKLQATGDDPAVVPSGYRRVMFEPVFLAGNDWTTIGGTFDDASLTNAAAQGTRYNFLTNAASYTVLVELSGFNRPGVAGYVAYANNPTNAAAGGRKNPGFDLNASNVRVEIDDVKLVVTDAATTGYLAPTTPAQLLRNGNFAQGEGNWSVFEGAYVNSTDLSWNQDNTPYLFIPGWSGSAYAGAMQNQIPFSATNGDFFTATFKAKFDQNYKATNTIVAFMDGGAVNELYRFDLADEINQNLGQWHTYTASFKATSNQLTTLNGAMTLKIQPLGRTVSTTEFSSALIDDVFLSQTNSAAIGPQIRVRINNVPQTDNGTNNLISPLVGKTATYTVKVDNTGAEDLTISSVNLTGSFTLGGITPPVTIVPGSSQSFSIIAAPTSLAALTGTLTINSNDKETSDQAFAVNLTATPVNLADSFNGSETASQLGWVPTASTTGLEGASSTSVTAGELQMNVDSSGDVYPWSYSVAKTFASPGTLNLDSSSLLVNLKASGVYGGLTQNKVQVRLESLNSALAVTGSIQLGTWVDETTAGTSGGAGLYFSPDGINDRVVVLVPEGGSSYTQAGGILSQTGVKSATFDASAPYYRLVIQMTDFEFDLDAGNLVQVDSVDLSLGVAPFSLANGSFELDATDGGALIPPNSWTQYPPDGVSKNVITNGAKIYNQSTSLEDATAVSAAFAGTKVMKVYGQNYFPGGVWAGPSQTGVVYQEFPVGTTPSLTVGAVIHARGMAKVFSIDPLTANSTFNYGFKYMNQANEEIGRQVTTLTSANFTADKWVPLTVNGTVPANTAKVQVISEFVQSASTGKGAVYLDDLSIGFGTINATATVGSSTYTLTWSDEFDGTALNAANWTPETGAGGWGNNEQQTYTTNSSNLRIDSGSLILQAVKSGPAWTSARIKSQGLRSFQYGKIEFRAKLPSGVGPWPAAWMMGTNLPSAGWPNCGEIDVMEWRSSTNGGTADANTVGHALHSATRSGSSATQPASRSSVTNPSSAFHTYAVVWTSNNMVFSIDGTDKATLTPPTADAAAFRQEFFLLLNLAMGGTYVGNNISSSLTSATYEVDYVRVYQGASAPVVSDTTPPVITLLGTTPVSVNWGATYSDAGATASDAGDNASVTVTTSNGVNVSVPGSYLVTYTATDSKSNTATTNRTVNVAMANSGTNRGTDGLTDILRYAFGGTNTNALSTSLLPSNSVNGANLVLTYYARTNANVVLTPVVSTDLASSNSWTNTGITVTNLTNVTTNGVVLQKRQASTPISGTKKFLRLKATYTP